MKRKRKVFENVGSVSEFIIHRSQSPTKKAFDIRNGEADSRKTPNTQQIIKSNHPAVQVSLRKRSGREKNLRRWSN